MNDIMWTDVNVLTLVEEYRKHPCLWDPSDNFFKVLQKKSAAWIEVAYAMQSTVPEVKRKMASVLASFRRERKREGRSNWFAYKHLAFLLEKFNTGKSKSREGDDVDDFNDTEDWWKENETMTTENDIFISSDIDDKSDIKIFDEFRNGLQNSNPIETRTLEDTPQEIIQPSVQHSVQPKRPPPRKKIKLSRHFEDIHDEPEFVEVGAKRRHEENSSPRKTISQLFTAYVAAKLETYSEYRRNVVQHKITEILFKADMGNFDKSMSQQTAPMETLHSNEDTD